MCICIEYMWMHDASNVYFARIVFFFEIIDFQIFYTKIIAITYRCAGYIASPSILRFHRFCIILNDYLSFEDEMVVMSSFVDQQNAKLHIFCCIAVLQWNHANFIVNSHLFFFVNTIIINFARKCYDCLWSHIQLLGSRNPVGLCCFITFWLDLFFG